MFVEAKQNIWSESEQFLLKRKNGFPFVLLRSKNTLVEAKRKVGREKKRKNRAEFFNWTSETHAKRIQFCFISLINDKNCMRNGRTLHPLLVVELKKYISLCISIQYMRSSSQFCWCLNLVLVSFFLFSTPLVIRTCE